MYRVEVISENQINMYRDIDLIQNPAYRRPLNLPKCAYNSTNITNYDNNITNPPFANSPSWYVC